MVRGRTGAKKRRATEKRPSEGGEDAATATATASGSQAGPPTAKDRYSVDRLHLAAAKRGLDWFGPPQANPEPGFQPAEALVLNAKVLAEYGAVKDRPEAAAPAKRSKISGLSGSAVGGPSGPPSTEVLIEDLPEDDGAVSGEAIEAAAAKLKRRDDGPMLGAGGNTRGGTAGALSSALMIRAAGNRARKEVKPAWQAPWKLARVISGHTGWVRSLAVDPTNEWFATGSNDRTIKIWDLASGTLKLTLTGHISAVRGLAISARSPYLFSVGEDKMIKCWDLEANKVIRSYHGHLSGLFSVALHPTIDLLITGGRDASVRVWDIRTKVAVHVFGGHTSSVASLVAQPTDPQVISGSMDNTVRLWNLVAGRCQSVLTNHKRSVRAMVAHPIQNTFASGSSDNIKQWKLPEGHFIKNLSGQKAIISAMALNRDGVLFSGGDNGSMHFWDWNSGYNYQTAAATVQPGSLDSEAGICAAAFDMTGSRLLLGEADKTIKVWKPDLSATEETHPVRFNPAAVSSAFY